MKFDKIIKSSVKCLILNPLRTFLSLLGIIIGIAGVVAVINLGESTKEKIKEFVSLMGSDTFRIDVSDLLNPAVEVAIKQPPSRRLTIEDFVMIKKLCPHVEEVCELLSVVYPTKDENLMINAFGTLPNFANLAKIKLIKGRFINDTDIKYRRYVCVLEQSPLIIKIFGKIPSIGEILTFGTEKFELVGIVKREKLLFPGRETILETYVPYTTVIERIRNVYGEIYVSVEKPQDVKIAMKEVDEILRSLFVGKQPYKTFSHEVLLKESLKTVSTSTLLMTGIAILSLIVGSIGIMNVMFISVVERTREIGIRKSVGATKKDILVQFLLESTLICVIGGIIGILLGLAVTYYLTPILQIKFVISETGIVVGMLFSMFCGILSGTLPSIRASNLEPLEALRYE